MKSGEEVLIYILNKTSSLFFTGRKLRTGTGIEATVSYKTL